MTSEVPLPIGHIPDSRTIEAIHRMQLALRIEGYTDPEDALREALHRGWIEDRTPSLPFGRKTWGIGTNAP